MEPVASGVTLRKDPRSVICTILAIELLNIEVVLDEDLGKSLDIERRLATGQTIPVGRKGHMSPWLRGIKIIPIPAAWETDRSGEAIRITVREALREACGLSIGAAMALPLELATGGAHATIVRPQHGVAGDHAESLGELASLEVRAILTCSVLVVDAVVWLLRNTDHGTVLGMEVERRHPVVALVRFDTDGAAGRGLGLGVVHGGSEAVATND